MRRRSVNDGEQLHGDGIIAAGEHQGTGVRKADIGCSRCDFLDRVDGALAAKNVHVEPFGLVIPLLERDVVIGVSPIEAEIGDEIHVGSLCRKRAARGRGRGHENAQSSKRPHD